MQIKRVEPKTYTYNITLDENDEEYTSCVWADFIFNCDSGRLVINSDAGDYSYCWGFNKNEDFMHLMGRVNRDYLLKKLSYENCFLLEESKNKTINMIEDIGYNCFDFATEEDWKNYKEEILNLDSLVAGNEIHFWDEIEKLVPEIDERTICIEKDYPYGAKLIVDIFIKYLQPKIREEFNQ